MRLYRKNRAAWNFKWNGHFRTFVHRTRYGTMYRINMRTMDVERFSNGNWVVDNRNVRPAALRLEEEF